MRRFAVIGFILLLAGCGKVEIPAPVNSTPRIERATLALAQSVTVTWDANLEPNIAGYTLFWGSQSRIYSNQVDVILPVAVATGLVEGRRYFFAAKARNTEGLESEFSDEISYLVPGGPTPTIAPTPTRTPTPTVTVTPTPTATKTPSPPTTPTPPKTPSPTATVTPQPTRTPTPTPTKSPHRTPTPAPSPTPPAPPMNLQINEGEENR